MTRRRFVHEKTLELNLSAEVLSAVRSTFPRAFLLGMTQERESRNGVDAAIQSMRTMLGAIQYKAPLRPRYPDEWEFVLNGLQLVHLQSLERWFPGRVAYFLPRIGTRNELSSNSPLYLQVTNALQVGPLAPDHHRAIANSSRDSSLQKPVRYPATPARQLLDEWLDRGRTRDERGQDQRPPDPDRLATWLDEVEEAGPRSAGQTLRGLTLIGIPEGEDLSN